MAFHDIKCQWKMDTWKHSIVWVFPLACICASLDLSVDTALASELAEWMYDTFD